MWVCLPCLLNVVSEVPGGPPESESTGPAPFLTRKTKFQGVPRHETCATPCPTRLTPSAPQDSSPPTPSSPCPFVSTIRLKGSCPVRPVRRGEGSSAIRTHPFEGSRVVGVGISGSPPVVDLSPFSVGQFCAKMKSTSCRAHGWAHRPGSDPTEWSPGPPTRVLRPSHPSCRPKPTIRHSRRENPSTHVVWVRRPLLAPFQMSWETRRRSRDILCPIEDGLSPIL